MNKLAVAFRVCAWTAFRAHLLLSVWNSISFFSFLHTFSNITDPSPSANASVSATAAGGAAATSPSTPKTIGLLLALYNANVTTDWVTVAKAAQEIPIRAIIPVPGQLNSIKIVPSHRRILHSLCFHLTPSPKLRVPSLLIFAIYIYIIIIRRLILLLLAC